MLVFSLAASAEGASWRGSVGLGAEYASGSFGTGVTSDAVTTPLTVALYPTKRLDFSLEIPYLFQRGGTVTSSVNRSIAGQQMHAKAGHMPQMGSGAAVAADGAADGGSAGASNGIGDVTLKGGYLLVEEGELLPAMRATLSVKFPTGDREEALGTGAFDEAGGVELSKWLGDWYSLASLGYTVQGKVAGAALQNYLSYNASLGYQLTDHFIPLIMLKGTTTAADGTGGTLQARVKGIWALTDKTALEGYLSKGLTAASPDFGAGLAVYRYF